MSDAPHEIVILGIVCRRDVETGGSHYYAEQPPFRIEAWDAQNGELVVAIEPTPVRARDVSVTWYGRAATWNAAALRALERMDEERRAHAKVEKVGRALLSAAREFVRGEAS